ncbi:unnamed protein product [Ilex paraguariensis]|uniref:Ethylene-insensitive protein 2 n=1 Tax=Ilex paraguariensis TaxID=185542 RepID=A0ABC8RY91_9AQUA
MDTDSPSTNHQPNFHKRLCHAVAPVLLVAIGYVDPGKWTAAVEGGARFGFDLITLMLTFNFAAILCHYLCSRIAVVTGRGLAQICGEEYDKVTCIFLGVQAELSMITLDLTMILGTAHGFNLLLGMDLFTCTLLTAIDAVLFPVFATLQESAKLKFLCICMASCILLSYAFGVIISLPEIPTAMDGTLTKLSGESVFALMSLLGASIMPHTFYLHSSIVEQNQGPTNASKASLCNDHFLAILCIFSGIFLVNYLLINSAANVFYSTGLVLLTFQDSFSLMDQVVRSSIAPFALIIVMVFSNQLTALTWNVGRQAVLHDLFRMDIPGWLHHATIRIIALVAALYSVWKSGAEGIYQMLIFTQVVVALVLPSSVIPLFRVASSQSVMGVHKVSQFGEFLALTTFIGMLGLNIIFVTEMIFGNSDWVSNLRWSMGNSTPISYVVLLVIAFVSLGLMLWLAATPLKSASSKVDAQAWSWEMQNFVPESSAERIKHDLSETRYHIGESTQWKEPPLVFEKYLGSHQDLSTSSPDLNLPERLFDADSVSHLTTIEEKYSGRDYSSPSVCLQEESESKVEKVLVPTISNKVSEGEVLDVSITNTESVGLVEKILRIEGDLQTENHEVGDTWKPEESSKEVSGGSPSLTSEGPGSFRSLSGKSDDVGSGSGSLSRLAGLGRTARRQLTTILDEFWGQLFDFYGQETKEARAKKLVASLGLYVKVDLKSASGSLKVDNNGKECSGCFPYVGERVSDSVINSSLYESQQSSYGAQRGLSSISNPMQLLNAQNSAIDPGERRYSTLRVPPSSNAYDEQPATIHGYQFASYLSRLGKERSFDYLNGQMESLTPKSRPLLTSNCVDPLAHALRRKPQNGASLIKPPGFPDLPVARSSLLQSERPFYGLSSPEPTENASNTVSAKKYYSLPDISGLYIPHREPSLSDRSSQQDGPMAYWSSVSRAINERSLYSNTSSKVGAALSFGEFSPSKVCRDVFSPQFSSNSDTGSLWSRQPFEQFGVADKTRSVEGARVGESQSSITEETAFDIDLEAKLLQSFRHCILKLLKLEGSDWLFRQNDGADEDLIDRVAARERFIYEFETREMNHLVHMGDAQFSSGRKPGSALRNDESDNTKFLVTSVPRCGEGCIWRLDLIISFGVWCIHRVLELSLMESRPELWGKYTCVLNRLQGIIDVAFLKPRSPMVPCFCLQIPVAYQQRSSPPISNGSLPPPARQGRGKCTTAAMLLDIVKDVEIAISCRKGRAGTAAGDVAFPKGKENLSSVLKRYKRRLSSKSVGTRDGGPGLRKVPASAYGS